MDYGFSAFHTAEILKQGETLGQVPVISGAEDMVDAYIETPFFYTLDDHEQVSLLVNLPPFVYAPVLAGESAGTVSVLVDGTEIASLPLCWRYSVLEEA